MLCDICKKQKASVHLTEIINDEVTELHLCEDCAKTRGTQMQQHFGIADLLSGLMDFPIESTQKKEHIKLKCPSCSMSYSDFKKVGRFGCAQCYEAFKRALYPLLKRIHGSTRHIGKSPKKLPAKKTRLIETRPKPKPQINELEELKARLTKAIEREEFEEAAVLRDKIKALEKRIKDKG